MEKKYISLDSLPVPKINPLQTPRAGVKKPIKVKLHLDDYYSENFINSYFNPLKI